MTFIHLPLSPRRRRSRLVVDQAGRAVRHAVPDELAPTRRPPAQDLPPESPADLPTARPFPRRSVTVREEPAPPPERSMTWEERLDDLSAFWEHHIGGRLSQLAGLVREKSAFDDVQMQKWSDHLRIRRVGADRQADVQLLEDRQGDSTRELAGLRDAITARILADALAATP